MPRYLDQDKKKLVPVVIPKVWYLIPIERGDSTTPINYDVCLIPSNVADYIEKLEQNK